MVQCICIPQQDRLDQKEGNKAAKNKDIECHYCHKKGHKSYKCHKKKKDAEEKEKKEKGKGTQIAKAVNAHINIATIEEIKENEDLAVSLYTAAQS